ncbi:hypothetical protein CEY16_14390 [Halalkalibacillus sediminis]|uniref:Uncharacterized protein n=1 Tax=Halalkalibacillus sediminis TaxID=2018042 RepID=A0A2I0QQD7_9BACI|nr:hypothetical protein [Halalkalibacillus sediminis]PKR76545.1 hypothetical protein CEY16_14390 [Halalkalibacillus sediminis]
MKALHYKIVITFLLLTIILGVAYYELLYKPKDTIELYQSVNFSDPQGLEELFLDDYHSSEKQELLEEIIDKNSTPWKLRQFSLFQYGDDAFIIETSPGTHKLKIIDVRKIPNESLHPFN